MSVRQTYERTCCGMDSGADEHVDCDVLCESLSFPLNLKQKKPALAGFYILLVKP